MKPKYTTQNLNDQKRENSVRIQEAQKKIEALTLRRGELLLQLSAGDEKASKELATIEKEFQGLRLQIESHEALLSTLPKFFADVRADEVEVKIKAIEDIRQEIVELTAKVDDSAETFALAVSDLYKAVGQLSSLMPKGHNPPLYYDLGVLDSLGVALRKHDLFKFIKVGKFRDALLASETIKRTLLNDIDRLISRQGEFVEVLRGKMQADSKRCPECYENLKLRFPGRDDKYCESCGYESGGNKA